MTVEDAEQITSDHMQGLLAKWQEIPMAHILTTVFLENADIDNLWLRHEHDGKIYAQLKGRDDITMCIWSMYGNRVDLEISEGNLDNIPQQGYISVCFNELVSFIASEKDVGVWTIVRGNLKTYGISINLQRRVVFPSEIGRWFFEFLYKFSIRATELHLDVSEQPHFWDGMGKDD